MFLDSEDFLDLSIKGIHEPFETRLVRDLVKRGDVVLDIGAHIGYYTLMFAKLVGEEGRVFAFEPDPGNFALLQKNVEENAYRNVVLVPKAVSDKTGNIRLYLCDRRVVRTIYDTHGSRGWIEIESVRLDDYFAQYKGGIDFIKMDVEGAEGLAIRGMALLLQKHKDIKIMMEFWPIALKMSGVDPGECLQTLLRYGFKLYHIDSQREIPRQADPDELLKMYPPREEDWRNLRSTNLLCVRQQYAYPAARRYKERCGPQRLQSWILHAERC